MTQHLRPGWLLLLLASLWACTTPSSSGARPGARTRDAVIGDEAQDTRDAGVNDTDRSLEVLPELPAPVDADGDADDLWDGLETVQDLEQGTRRFVVLHTLAAFPQADLVISNSGGLRDDLDAGAITLADIVEVLPFENDLYLLSLTGDSLRQSIGAGMAACGGAGCFVTISGARYFYADGAWQVSRPDGAAFGANEPLVVVVTDYMWQGGAGFGILADLDPEPTETGVLMRQPVIDGTRALHTDSDDPLEAHVDPTRRDVPYAGRY